MRLGGTTISKILSLVPSRCVLCQHAAQHDNLCSLCWRDLPRLPRVCRRCALPIVLGSVCGPCLLTPPSWTRLICAVPYAEPFNTLITRLKFNRRVDLAQPLAALLLERLRDPEPISAFDGLSLDEPLQPPDVAIPLPLHWSRLWSRGFNQTELLTQPIAEQLNLPIYRPLRRTRRTRAQTLIAPGRRKTNLSCAFDVTHSVKGLHVALIDDVVTTGATADSASSALLRAGARSVHVWACARARAPHPGRSL